VSDISDLIAAQIATLTEIAERFAALQVTQVQFANWAAGTATGGPNGDGNYPFTDAAGVVRMLPCVDKIKTSVAYDLAFRFMSAPDPDEVIGFWYVATPFTIKANMLGSGGVVKTPPDATPYVVSLRSGGSLADPASGTLLGTITVSVAGVFTFATVGGVDVAVPVGLLWAVGPHVMNAGITGFAATVKG
jgi:hypothetical protein